MLRELDSFARENGAYLYLVGGAVRDLLLGRKITDYDFAMAHGAEALAKTFGDRIDAAFVRLDEHPPTVRLVVRSTGLTLDFAAFRAETLDADLRLRDFTVNAMAFPLADLLGQPNVQLIDPCNGYEAVRQRLLRFCSERVILDDPLRLLRAFRFAAQLQFDLPDDTLSAVRQHQQRLRQTAWERIRDEFIKILDTANSATYIRLMDDIGPLSHLLPEIDSLRGVEQNDYHHLDVWQHSLFALEQYENTPIPDILTRYQSEINEYLNHHLVYNKRREALIKLALLLHDIAKPATKHLSPQGNWRFIGHEKVGAEMAVAVTHRLRLGGKAAKLMNGLVRNHLYPMNLINGTRRAMTRFLRNTGEDWIGILLLSYADLRASRGPLRRYEDITQTEVLMRSIADLYYQQILPVMTKGRLISGRDVIQVLGLKPGVQIGRVLKHIEDLQFDGRIHTREEALEAARRFLALQ